MVFLPCHGDISKKEMDALSDRTVEICLRYNKYLAHLETQSASDIRPRRTDVDEGPIAKL